MKKIIELIKLTCTALILGQACILGLSAARGNLNKNSLIDVIAILNGIDIQGARIAKALTKAREAPLPSHEEIAELRLQKDEDLRVREKAINRKNDQLLEKENLLKDEKARFDERVARFNNEQKKRELSNRDKDLEELRQTLETLPPENLKSYLMLQLSRGDGSEAYKKKKENIATIFRAFDPDVKKKLLEQFSGEEAKLDELIGPLWESAATADSKEASPEK